MKDDRIVFPLGCTEQHAYLSLGTDTINTERVAVEAAEPLGIPVLPAFPYGIAPHFTAYPGTPSLRPETLASVVADVLDSLHAQGFGRIAIVSFHSGEDRLVKKSFRDNRRAGVYADSSDDPIIATLAESQSNPRSRSAKLTPAVRVWHS